MKQFLFAILILFSSQSISAQNFGSAILLNSEEVGEKYDKILLKKFHEKYNKQKPIYTDFYSWNGDPESAPIPLEEYNDSSRAEQPITTAINFVTNLQWNEICTPSFKVDTTGKVTNMYLDYNIGARPMYKVVDLATSEVLASKSLDTKTYELGSKLEIKNFKDYFGSKNPKKLQKNNSDSFKAIMKKINKEYNAKIVNHYTEVAENVGADMSSIASFLKSKDDERLWKMVNYDLNSKGKLKEFYIDANASENLVKNELLEVFRKVKFGEFQHYDRIGYIIAKEVTADQTMVKPILFSKNKIAEALEANDDVVFVRNTNLIKRANQGEREIKRAQIKGDCFMCNKYLEKILLGLSSIKVIERNFDGPTRYFTSQYTDEKFIDFDMSAIQDKQEGVNYLFEKTKAGMKATDVTTGRVSQMNKKESKGIANLLGSTGGPETINLCMDIMDENIKILEILKEKKGKVQKILAYSPFSFDNIATFRIVILKEEQVGGRSITREEEIGKAFVGKKLTESIANIKISKGEKELYQAIQANEKIKFIVKI